MESDLRLELDRAIKHVVQSQSPRRLVVAGPGTGKTHLFRSVLEATSLTDRNALILTFINNLKDELAEKLSDLARVFTFHGYCHRLLRREASLRAGLSHEFLYFPKLASIVKQDWEVANGSRSPQFVGLMRNLEAGDAIQFYLKRSNYYDAVSFDDSVFRVYQRLSDGAAELDRLALVAVDEYQDFNALEAAFIDLLASRSPILIVGDDDQALYSQLRGSTHEFIRRLHRSGDYECFELPFCLRCPKPVVEAINDVVARAKARGNLRGRIDKPYQYFAPFKAKDSQLYPRLVVLSSTVQSNDPKVNYWGRYIAAAIRAIPDAEIHEAIEGGFPTVLIIGSPQYLKQVAAHLSGAGFRVESKEEVGPERLERADGLAILREHPQSNLGWRVLLEVDRPDFAAEAIRWGLAEGQSLAGLLPAEYRERTLAEVSAPPIATGVPVLDASPPAAVTPEPTIRLTSFEGSKGLSAQHVFVVGLHDGELPKDASNVGDLEICRFIVALTRTRKQCYLMTTSRFSGKPKSPSAFLNWIQPSRKQVVHVSREYWAMRAE